MKNKIISWNCQGINAKKLNLQNIIIEKQPDIICLQETQINPNDTVPNFKGYQSYFYKRPTVTRAHGGTGILIRPQIPQEFINITTGIQATIVKVTIDHPLSICSIYISEEDWRQTNKAEIANFIKNIPNPKIITGDWNARNKLWFSNINCKKGLDLEEIFDELDMIVIDEDKDTHISTAYGSTSHIDISIVSPSLRSKISWSTLDDTYNSDHFPIEMEIETNPTPSPQRPKWNLHKANWTKYKEQLKLSLPQQIDNIQNLVNTVTEKIVAAAKGAIPIHETYPKRIPVPWWNVSCKLAKEKRVEALKEYKNNMTVANAIKFKQQKAKTTLIFNQAKKESWIDYVSQLSSNTPINKVWKRISRIQGKRSFPTITHMTYNNQKLQSKKEIVEDLATNFQDQQSCKNSSRAFTHVFRTSNSLSFPLTQGKDEPYNANFTIQELKEVIKSAGNTSIGPDLIHYQFLKEMMDKDLEVLLKFYNHIWNSGIYPEQWKKALIIPILKKNKNPSIPSSYRPISLTSCIGKILEKLVNRRLYWYLETNNYIPKQQSGFRKGRSTTDNLIWLENDIRHAILNKQFLVAVFLDIEKAYDSCWMNTILDELNRSDLKGKLPHIIKSFLTNRSFQVCMDDTLSTVKETELGVPQGSSLSVTLFSMAINIYKKYIPAQISSLVYVDDMVLYHSSSQIRTSERILQRAVNKIQEWSDKTNFRISKEKSTVMKFTSNFHNQETPRIQISNSDIPVVSRMKFLGMILDKSLKWGPHILDLKAKAGRAANLLKITTNTKWGADTKTSLILYKVCVRPILDYGAVLYSSAAKSNLDKLDTIQNQCLRSALGAFKTSPVESLQVEANIHSLNLRREYLTLRYTEKVRNVPRHPISDILENRINDEVLERYPGKIPPPANRIEKLKEKYSIQDLETKSARYLSPPWYIIPPPVCNNLSYVNKSEPQEIIKQKFIEHSSYHPTPHIFTDGSGGINNKGSSVCFPSMPHYNKKDKLPWEISIFTAEAFAIKQAFGIISREKLNSATIFTDSKSVLQALEVTNHPNDIVAKIVNTWDELSSKGVQIHVCWSPGHVGIAGNEEADKLAKEATVDGTNTNLPITVQEFSSVIKRKQIENWQNVWDRSQAKLKIFKPRVAPLTILPVKNRREEAILRRLRIGHTIVTHQYLLKRPNIEPICTDCGNRVSVYHLLYRCQRQSYPKSPFLSLNPHENDLSEVSKVKKVIDFINTKKIKV